MKKEMKNGQVTLFIIVGLIVAVSVFFVFMFVIEPKIDINPQENPKEFIEKCMQDALKISQDKILPKAGHLSYTNYLRYNNTDIPYLCYTSVEKTLCQVTQPVLRNLIERNLETDTIAKIDTCFNQLRNSFSQYNYKQTETNYKVEILPDKILATVNKNIEFERDGQITRFTQFTYEEASPIFDFIILSNEILTRELKCDCEKESCSADVLEMSRVNPTFELNLFVTGGNEKIYSIKDRFTNKQFMFSVRNCIRLP